MSTSKRPRSRPSSWAVTTSPLAVRCDVTQAAEVEALIQTAVERFGGLDIMVNNAGITRDATMRKMTEEQFDQVIACT